MTKQELTHNVKALRNQINKLEVRCQEREDKLLKVLLSLEPFVQVLTSAQQKEMMRLAGMEEQDND
jgi:hypothetical protein